MREIGPRRSIGIHAHDDAGLAVANSLAAVQAGATSRAGHHQRLRRALRQRQPRARSGRTSRSSSACPTVPAGDDLTRLPSCRTSSLRWPTSRPTRTGPTSARARSRTRAACTAPRRCACEQAYQHVDPAVVGGDVALGRQRARGRGNAPGGCVSSDRSTSEGIDSAEMSPARQAARGGGRQLRGRRCVVRAARRAGGATDYEPPFRHRRLHGHRRAPQRRRAARRGEREGRGRRRGPAHRGRRQRAGQRARPGAAQGAGRASTPPSTACTWSTTRSASSTARRRRRARTRVIIETGHRVRDLDHRRRGREHHRGLAGRAPRLVRVRDLAARRPSANAATSSFRRGSRSVTRPQPAEAS